MFFDAYNGVANVREKDDVHIEKKLAQGDFGSM
jgi:hypothetical protein